jgi:beta-lactamase class A
MHHIFTLNRKKVVLGIVMVLCGVLIGLAIGPHIAESSKSRSVRENNSNFKFINPILYVDNKNVVGSKYGDLKVAMNSLIDSSIKNNEATNVAVYFRDLNSGQWVGVHENDEYTPASMLKVALLIAYLRGAETDPGILDKLVRLSPNSFNLNSLQSYKPKDPIVPGNTYTIGDLLLRMSISSDNNAMALLTDAISTSSVSDLYSDLELPVDQNGEVTHLSPELYSHFFRILYNSSYVSHNLSEKILDILSQTDFTHGLQAGVPTGTVISHKFGERTITNNEGVPTERQLHDCGIVYFKDHPYFLCVMTKGQDFKALEGVISTLSREVWGYVSEAK